MALGKRAQTASVTTLLSTSRKGRGHTRGRGEHRVYTFAPTARPSPKFRRGQRKHLCRPPSKDGQHRLFRRCKATSLTIPYHTTQWTSFGASIVSCDSFRGHPKMTLRIKARAFVCKQRAHFYLAIFGFSPKIPLPTRYAHSPFATAQGAAVKERGHLTAALLSRAGNAVPRDTKRNLVNKMRLHVLTFGMRRMI